MNTTAIHEGGHAVMALRGRSIIGVITIVPKDHSLGHVTCDTDWQATARGARRTALVNLAGWAAVEAAGLPDAGSGCEFDFEEARSALAAWNLGSLDDWKKKALRIMRLPRNLKAVAAVADRLTEHGTLDYDQVDMIVEAADGRISEAELARWEAMRRAMRST